MLRGWWSEKEVRMRQSEGGGYKPQPGEGLRAGAGHSGEVLTVLIILHPAEGP